MNKYFNDEESSVIENDLDNEQIDVYVKTRVGSGNKLFIGILCVLIAVGFWCYANYLDDPIIIREINVEFVLSENGVLSNVVIDKEVIEVYGEKSVLSSIPITTNTLVISVDINEFKNSETINFQIKYPDGIHSHVTQQQLTYKMNDE